MPLAGWPPNLQVSSSQATRWRRLHSRGRLPTPNRGAPGSRLLQLVYWLKSSSSSDRPLISRPKTSIHNSLLSKAQRNINGLIPRWLQTQLSTLQKYHTIAQRYEMMKRKQAAKGGRPPDPADHQDLGESLLAGIGLCGFFSSTVDPQIYALKFTLT